MYLKRLELFGFKSFADRTELEFGPGITVVVGPNGSGKSNVSDAIRWVLGEQSARELRGARMEDVIFAGSDGKKPMGFAQVSLILDNSDRKLPVDFTEVMVTRRVDRAGGSEYLINQVPCRLKDVHDLFLDTGIGKENYSVVGQGKIDEILSSKPEDRRALFEEAAGISRYKARKREATRRLDDTEQNLLRITDVIGELENQIESLREQAEKAEIYQGLNQELTALDIGLLAYGLRSVASKLEMQRSENERIIARLRESEERLAVAEEAMETARNLVESIDAELGVKSTQVAEATGHLERAEGRLALVRQQEQSSTQEAQRLDLEINSLDGKIDAVAEEQTGLTARLAEAAQALAQATEDLSRQEKALLVVQAEVADSGRAVESLRSEMVGLLQQEATLKNSVLSQGRIAEETARRLARLAGERDRASSERDTAFVAADQVKQELAAMGAQRAVGSESLSALRSRRGQLDEAIEALSNRHGNLREQIQGASSRLGAIEEMANQFDGYQKGPRTVLLNRERFGGEILGSIAELVRTEARHEKAIEVALGGNIQNIVTATENGAKAAIEHLKRADGGRATFLPLGVIRPASFRPDEAKEYTGAPGIIGVALDLLQFETRFAPAISALLGRVLVAEDIEAALRFNRKTGMRYRIVTLEGELLAAGGALTGGSLGGRSSGLLSREREREELTAGIAAYRTELAKVREEGQAAQAERARLTEEIGAAERELRQLETRATQAEGEVRRLDGVVQRWDEVLGTHDEEERRLRAEEQDGAAAERRLEQELAELAERRGALEARVKQMTEEGLEQSAAMEAKQQGVTGLRVRLAELGAQQRALEGQADRLRAETDSLKQERDGRSGQRQQITLRLAELVEEMGLLKAEVEGAGRAKAELEQERNRLQARKVEVQEQANSRDREIRSLRRSQTEAQTRLSQGEVEEHRLKLEQEQLTEQLDERHGLSPVDVVGRELPEDEVATCRQRAHDLREQIRELGPVNLAAIEEYRGARDRHEFLLAQRGDLEEAKESLYRAIEELDKRIRTHFLEAFQTIRREFSRVYQELFEGGRADLQLVDEQNLLETGIEIIAQPPGKKLQSLSALSGGERAMTATALLFALLRVRPSPFVVLDEVEAALDEANVERFARYLRTYARDVQFVCITHQRGTMEIADALYGVTMEGAGISKVVSVRLVEAERHAS